MNVPHPLYQYDPNSRLTNRWSAAKGNTGYAYDPLGNLTNVSYSVSPSISLGYDALNRLTNMFDAVGRTVYTYDAVGQLLSEGGLWPNDTVSFTYANRLRTGLGIAEPAGYSWIQTYGYDSARRLTDVTSPAGAFGYHYDPVELQRVDALTLPNGADIINAYDSVARLTMTALVNSSGVDLDSYEYTYNQANERTEVVRTAGDYVNYTYDNEGELTGTLGHESSGTLRLLDRFNYTYDAAGNLLSRARPFGALTTSFSVNTLNQITNAGFGTYSPLGGWSGSLNVSGSTTSAATNVAVNGQTTALYADNTFALNTAVTQGVNVFTAYATNSAGIWSTNISVVTINTNNSAYAYDLNGNLLTDGTRNFAYDDENELISVWATNLWRNDFTYDGKMRRRIEKDFTWTGSTWAETNETHFIYDGNLVVEERNTNNQPVVEYSRGNDLSGTLQGAGGIGGLLARSQNSLPPTAFYSAHAYYHVDGNGNVTALINPGQSIVAKYLYDAFGNILAKAGSLADANSYRFSSKEWNANSALYYYLYRFYEPNLHRWQNRDPLGDIGSLRYVSVNRHRYFNQFFDAIQRKDGLNLYEMVQNNPISLIDRFGLESSICASLRDQIQAAIANLFSGPMGTYNPTVGMQLANLQNLYNVYNCDDDNDDGNNPPPEPTPCPTGPNRVPKPKPQPVPVMPIVPLPSPAPAPLPEPTPIPEPIPVEPIFPIEPISVIP